MSVYLVKYKGECKLSNIFNKIKRGEGGNTNRSPEYYLSINWNEVEDAIDKATWEKLTQQFWLDTRIPVSNDVAHWRKMSSIEQDSYSKAFMGLTMLDTLQSEEGNVIMGADARTQHEKAVISNIHFMESVHAKSYSTIFSTLLNNKEISELFDWGDTNEFLQFKARTINEVYQTKNSEDKFAPWKKKVASVFLESFLFYSGFYSALRYLGSGTMVNCAEIIKLILRDESVHGTYLGYKSQLFFNELNDSEQNELKDWMYQLLFDLYENEVKYAHELYDQLGWTEDVIVFVEYNANKALQNLGFEIFFPNGIAENVNPIVMNGISTETNNFDFFSQVGNGYLMGEAESMDDDDYDF